MKFRHLSLSLIAMNLATAGISAQTIKTVNPDFKGYEALLNAAGYELYSFDISSLAPKKYAMTFSVKEFRDGKEVHSSFNRPSTFHNLTNISDFTKWVSDKKEIDDIRQKAIDPANDVFSKAERINIGLYPGEADSIKNVLIEIDTEGSSGFRMKLLPLLKMENVSQTTCNYMYNARTFIMPEIFHVNEFIPLVGVMSFYYDNEYNVFRCCGETNLSPDIQNSALLNRTPHAYIIGVTLKEEKENK